MITSITLEPREYNNIAGGEFSDEAGVTDEYYLQFNGLDISIDSENLKRIAVDAINHLMVNGHKFSFGFTDMGQKEIRDEK